LNENFGAFFSHPKRDILSSGWYYVLKAWEVGAKHELEFRVKAGRAMEHKTPGGKNHQKGGRHMFNAIKYNNAVHSIMAIVNTKYYKRYEPKKNTVP
jgi:hypothetical protein